MIQNRNNNWRAMTLSKAEGIGSTAQGRNSLFLVAGGKEGRDLSKRSDLVVGVHRILFWWLLFSQRNNKQYFWTTFSVKEMLENWARKKSKTDKKVRQWLDCRRRQHRASSGSAAESLKWGQLAGLFSSICLQLGRCRCRVEGDLDLSRFVVSPGQDRGREGVRGVRKQEQECNDRTRHLICSGGKWGYERATGQCFPVLCQINFLFFPHYVYDIPSRLSLISTISRMSAVILIYHYSF